MYYHVLVGNNGKGSFPDEVYELDIDDYNDVVNKYAIPRWRGYNFIVDSYDVDKRYINRFVVKESDLPSSKLVEKAINNGTSLGGISRYSPKDIFNDRSIKNITESVLHDAKSLPHDKNKGNFLNTNDSKNVFIVHGHDNELKYEVARFIDSIGLKSVILHEQPNRGQTLLQKLLKNTNEAAFAIVLYSPDDEGREKDKTELEPRARQNVVFEHGLLIGSLGPERVCALMKGKVEKPSDIDGVLYIPFSGQWQMDILKELNALGLDVRMPQG